jgi:6,7-dimethyl-8-ribityllumazine synthase
MIKCITFTRHISDAAKYDRLSSFFAALGLEVGDCRHDFKGMGRRFIAPIGGLEFVHAAESTREESLLQVGDEYDEIQIEVTSLDSIHEAAKIWLNSDHDGHPATLGEIIDTRWGSRLFTATPVPRHSVTFWEWTHPLKEKPLAVEGDLSAVNMRFAIVAARWNAVITDRLLQGSLDALLRSGARMSDIEILRVPGAWEIPSAARKVAESGNCEAVITLGLLLRGETAHYEAIYNEVSRGIGQSQQETGIPHAFGVLTCETLEQALDRAGLKAGNKGFEAACAAIEMVSLHRKIA